MIDDVYNTKILELAGAVPSARSLERADGVATKHSKLCGSKVSVEVAMDGDTVADIAMTVKACALGQAAASVVHGNAVGATLDEARKARDELQAMLKEDGEGPTGRFSDLAFLKPVKDYRARHASTMLATDALVEAMETALAPAAVA